MSEEINWGKVTEMEQVLQKDDEEKLKRVRVFNPKELVKRAKEIRELYDDDLGVIRYKLLTYAQLNEIMEKHPENKDRSMQLLFKMLAPASEGLTLEDIKAMPYEVVARLLTKLTKEGSFFPQKQSANGSAATPSPKP
ncbi:MAG: hypothetical protein ABSB89_05255 [Candidatus Bathyarchaeia archaeon]|jgi:hypothetical protein